MGINNLLLTLPSHVHFRPFILQRNTSGNRCPLLAWRLPASGGIERWVFTSGERCYLWTVCIDSVPLSLSFRSISHFTFTQIQRFKVKRDAPGSNNSHTFAARGHMTPALERSLVFWGAAHLFPTSAPPPSPSPQMWINSYPQTSLKIPSPGCCLFSQGPDQKRPRAACAEGAPLF